MKMKMLFAVVNRFALLLALTFSLQGAFGFYDPGVQRWINRDPVGEEGGLNLYQYGSNNSLGGVDPFGLTVLVSSSPFCGQNPNQLGPYTINIPDGDDWVADLEFYRVTQVDGPSHDASLEVFNLYGVVGILDSLVELGAGLIEGVFGGAAAKTVDHIALGIKAEGLEQTAAQIGARHLLDDMSWRTSLQTAIGNPSTKFTVVVDGFEGSSTYSQLMGAAQRGLTPAGRMTEWEVGQLYQAGRLGEATIMQGGNVIPNPVVP